MNMSLSKLESASSALPTLAGDGGSNPSATRGFVLLPTFVCATGDPRCPLKNFPTNR